MTCEDLRTAAAALAALPADAPERREAQSHAAACPECARALRQADRLQALLLSTGPDATPAVAPLSRTRAAIGAELRLARAARPWTALAIGIAALVGGTLAVACAQHHETGSAAVGAALGLGLLAALAAVAGAARPVAAAAVGVGAALLFAALTGWEDAGALSTGVGWSCAGVVLASALLPLATAVAAAARGWLPPTALAPAAAAGALAGEAALHLTCHAPRTEAHLLVFHAGAVVIAASIGAVAGVVWRRWPA